MGELRFHVLCDMAKKKKKSIGRNNILCLSVANAFIDLPYPLVSLFLSKGMLDLKVSIKLFLYQIYSFVSIFFNLHSDLKIYLQQQCKANRFLNCFRAHR